MKGVLHQWGDASARLLAHDRIPAAVVQEFERLAGVEVDLADLHLWRQGGAYTADQPFPAFDEHYLRTHAQASTKIIRFAAEQAQTIGPDDGVVTLLQRCLERCETIATQPLRAATPLIGTARPANNAETDGDGCKSARATCLGPLCRAHSRVSPLTHVVPV